MKSDVWQNSLCVTGLLHDYKIIRSLDDGAMEVCSRCKDRKFFKHNLKSSYYLSYHLRSALQESQPRFYKEYK